MKIVVNGQEMEKRSNITILELLKELKVEEKTMATAVNMEIVKREKWNSFILKENDRVEFLQFVGGG